VRPFLPSNFSGKHPSTTEVLRIGPNAKLLHIAAEAGDNGGRIDGKQSGRSGDTVNIEDSTELNLVIPTPSKNSARIGV
jgi:hypothetical protein